MKNKEEKCLKSNIIYKGKILTLNCDDVLCSNGEHTKREIVNHHGGVCILAEVDGKIPFVKQFRYAYKDEVLELPAGKIEAGEEPLSSAYRELTEETGLIADELIDYGEMYPSPGYTNEIIHLYVAKGLRKGEQHFDSDEVLDVIYLSKEDIIKMLENNEIKDAKTICLLYKYFGSKRS